MKFADLQQALQIEAGQVSIDADTLSDDNFTTKIINPFYDDSPLIITDASPGPGDGDTQVVIQGKASLLESAELDIVGTFALKNIGPDGEGTLSVILRYRLLGENPEANQWSFSHSFPNLPLVYDPDLEDDAQQSGPDHLQLTDSCFVLTTDPHQDAQFDVPLQNGLNFVGEWTPTGMLGVFESLMGEEQSLILYGPIVLPLSGTVTPPLPVDKFPWEVDHPVPGINLQASLGIEPGFGENMTLTDILFRIYTPLNFDWLLENLDYEPVMAFVGIIDIPSSGTQTTLTAQKLLGVDEVLIAGQFTEVELGQLSALTDITGGDDLIQSIPEQIRDKMDQLELENTAINLVPDDLLYQVGYTHLTIGMPNLDWGIFEDVLEINNISTQIIVSNPFDTTGQRAISGQLIGQMNVAGVPLDVKVGLPDVSIYAQLPESEPRQTIYFSDLTNALLPEGLTLPDELPDIEFSDITIFVDPEAKALSVSGITTIRWDFGAGGEALDTQVELSLNRTVLPPTNGQQTGTRQIGCTLRLKGQGPLEITDELILQSFNLAFSLTQSNEWTLSGEVIAVLFEKNFSLAASYNQTKTGKALSLAISLTPAEEMVSLEGLGALSLFSLALELEKQSQPALPATGSEQPTAQTDGQADNPTPPPTTGASAWKVMGGGRIQLLEDLIDFSGTLSLFKGSDGSAGLIFTPETARMNLPLPPNATLDLNFGGLSIVKGGTTTGSAGQTGGDGSSSSGWRFEAAVTLSISGWHEKAQAVLPDSITTTFRAGAGSVSLTADRMIDPFEFDLPDIEIDDDTRVSLGMALIEASNLSIQLGNEVALSANIGVGLPAELNNLFGLTSNGKPAQEVFTVYDPDDPENTKVKLQLSVSQAGVMLNPLTSFLQAIQLTQEGGHSWWYCDFGEYGQIRLQVPTFSYNGASSSFEASGGFETIQPLKIPLTPLKQLLTACQLGEAAAALPPGLPLKDVTILDEDDNFELDELIALVEAGIEGDLPPEVRDGLTLLGDHLDKLPDRFKQYLNINIPENFFFDIGVTPDGGVRLKAQVYEKKIEGQKVREEYDPIKLLFPTMTGPFPMLNGISLWGISFGTLAGGSLFLLQVDADLDQFDPVSLATSLLLPEDEAGFLPNSQELQRRLILDELFMIIVYQSVIPIPVPLFYDELGLEYLGLEGTHLQGHVRFPLPQINLSELGKLVVKFKQFFTERAYLLDPDDSPEDMNLVFSLNNDYLQLPEYLGGELLGIEGDGPEIDAYENLAHLMNGLKTLSLNAIIQAIPLENRVGSEAISFGPMSIGIDWLITTPAEFRSGAYQQLALTADQIDDFSAVLRAVAVDQTPNDEIKQGLVTFLSGEWNITNLANFEVIFGLVASGSMGFSTGFKFAGTIGDFIETELAGRVAINAPGRADRPQVIEGEITSQTGPFSLDFDGERDVVIINPIQGFPSTAITMECWLKSDDDTKTGSPISYASSDRKNNAFLWYDHQNLKLYVNNQNTGSTGVSVNDGQWHHLAVTWRNDTGAIRLYKDGQVAYEGTLAQDASLIDGGSLVFGQEQDQVGGGFNPSQAFKGTLQEVRLWNRVRSPEEIQADMFHQLSGYEPGLVGYWPLNEGSGQTAVDLVGDQHGTLQGAQWQQPKAPPVTPEAVFQLAGHSHLKILGRRVFEGNLQMSDGDFWLTGSLDLFPPESPLIVRGDLVGSLSDDQFYLAGEVQAVLAGLVLNQTKAIIDNDHISLDGRWLAYRALLTVDDQLTVRGDIAVDFASNLLLNVNVLIPTWPILDRFTIPHLPPLELNVTFDGDLSLALSEDTQAFQLDGKVSWDDNTIVLPQFDLATAPTSVADLMSATITASTDRILATLNGPFEIEAGWSDFGTVQLTFQRNLETDAFEVIGDADIDFSFALEVDINPLISDLRPFLEPFTNWSIPTPAFDVTFAGHFTLNASEATQTLQLDGKVSWDSEEITLQLPDLSAVPANEATLSDQITPAIEEQVRSRLNGPFPVEASWPGFGSVTLIFQRNLETNTFEVSGSVNLNFTLNLDITSRLPQLLSTSPFTRQVSPVIVDPAFRGEITFEITNNGATFWLEGSASWGNQSVPVDKFRLNNAPTNVSDLYNLVENKITNDVLMALTGLIDLTLKLGGRSFFRGHIPISNNDTATIQSVQTTFGIFTIHAGTYDYTATPDNMIFKMSDSTPPHVNLSIAGENSTLTLENFEINTRTAKVSGMMRGELNLGDYPIESTAYDLSLDGNTLKLSGGAPTNVGFMSLGMTGYLKSNGRFSFSGSKETNVNLDLARFRGSTSVTLRHSSSGVSFSATATGKGQVWEYDWEEFKFKWKTIWSGSVAVDKKGCFWILGHKFCI